MEGGGETAGRGRSSEPLFPCIAMVGALEIGLIVSRTPFLIYVEEKGEERNLSKHLKTAEAKLEIDWWLASRWKANANVTSETDATTII